MKNFYLIVLFVIVGVVANAQPGSLDPSFGTGGIVITPIGSSDGGYSIAIQTDGKIVVAGSTYNGINSYFALIRYNTNGTLDNTFGSGGKVTTSVRNSDDLGWSVAIQTDGKIVVAGYSADSINNDDFALVRYNTNGTLDNTFGSGGKVTTPVGNSSDVGRSVSIQTDGKIVIAGQCYIGSNYDFALVRYNTNGTLDNTFGSNGKVITPVGSANDYGYSISIQTDAKIVVAGISDGDFGLVRYNTNGTLDNTFGSGGKVITDCGGYDGATSVATQNDGKIVVAGWGSVDFALIRYTTNGALDNSFGTGGKVKIDFGSANDVGRSVAIQADGKIVVVGSTDNSGANYDFNVVRCNPDGSLDNTFGTGGKVTTPVGTPYDWPYSVAIQTDGKIIVAGESYNGSDYDFSVVRYNGDVVGIEEVDSVSDMSIYPNPTNGVFQITSNKLQITNIEIMNLLGETVFQTTVNRKQETLNLSMQPNGIYFMTIKTSEYIENKKIIINH